MLPLWVVLVLSEAPKTMLKHKETFRTYILNKRKKLQKMFIWSKTADGTMVHLIEPPDGPGNDLVPFHVAFEVENFDETVEILKNSKYEITNGPQIRHDGQRAIYIQDMDGNTIEFATHNNIKHSNRVVDAWGYTKNA